MKNKGNNFLGYKNRKVTSGRNGGGGNFFTMYLFGKGTSQGNRKGDYKSFKKSGGRKNRGLFF